MTDSPQFHIYLMRRSEVRLVEFRWISWNEEHLAKHGVELGEAEDAVRNARAPFPLVQADQRYLVWGRKAGGCCKSYSLSTRMTRSS